MPYRVQRSPRNVNAHRESLASHARHRIPCEASDPSRSGGLYANFTLKSIDWLQNHDFGTFASEFTSSDHRGSTLSQADMLSNVPTPATAFQNRQFSATSAAPNSNWRPSVPKPRFCSHAHIQGSTKRETPPTWQSSSGSCGNQKKGAQRRAAPAKPKACEGRKREGREECRELKEEREFGIDTANPRQTSRSARSHTRAVEGANSARTSTSRWTSMVSALPCPLQRRHTDLHETPISFPAPTPSSSHPASLTAIACSPP